MRELLQQALDALLDANNMALMELSIDDAYLDEITALREELAKPDVSTKSENVNTSEERVQISDKNVHEPVATVTKIIHNEMYWEGYFDSHTKLKVGTNLYTSPPRKEWVGLTSEELVDIVLKHTGSPVGQVFAIEAALRSKNE